MENIPFADLDLPAALQAALERQGFTTPTQVQALVLEPARLGRDLLIQAPTGSGKTAAFLLPMIERFHLQPRTSGGTRALVLVPTRELARQVRHQFLALASHTRLTLAVITGGSPYRHQIADLRKNPDLIVGTPGRLLELLGEDHLDFSELEMLVLDEADRMLDMGFQQDLLTLLGACGAERQSLLLSATLDAKRLGPVTDRLLRDPLVIETSALREAPAQITHQIVLCDDLPHRLKVLEALLSAADFRKAMVFANTREQVDQIEQVLRARGLRCASLHGAMDQKDRNLVLHRLRSGEIPVMIASDVAARGLDVDELDLVINFDLPRGGKQMLHRTGRTGRAGSSGRSISLVTAPDWNRMISIGRYLGIEFEQILLSGLEGQYRGPKRRKSSGKASGTRKITSKPPPKARPTPKQRQRDRRNIGKRRQPSAKPAEPAGPAGTGAAKRPARRGTTNLGSEE